MRLQGQAILFLDEHHQLERRDGIEHASRDQWCRVRKFGRVFAWKKLLDDEVLDNGPRVISHALPLFTKGSVCRRRAGDAEDVRLHLLQFVVYPRCYQLMPAAV